MVLTKKKKAMGPPKIRNEKGMMHGVVWQLTPWNIHGGNKKIKDCTKNTQ